MSRRGPGSRRLRGTALYAGVLAVLGITVAARAASEPDTTPAIASVTSEPTAPAASETSAGGTGSGSGSGTGPGSGTGTAPATPPAGTSSPASSSPSSPTATASTVKGSVEQTPYGDLQVSVTFSGEKITKVTQLHSPDDDGRSVMIDQYAAPILEQEVIASQSAKINGVSGATFTSEAYIASVQYALDHR